MTETSAFSEGEREGVRRGGEGARREGGSLILGACNWVMQFRGM